ncbi:MAG: hypothetical protein EPO02_01990, partial [Nitrospirae bacterium]
MVLLPGGAWALRSYHLEELRLSDFSNAEILLVDVISALGIELAKMYQQNPVLGLNPATGLLTAGVYAFLKRVKANNDWAAANLAADQAAFPAPSYPEHPAYPIDRVITGKITYGANDGFALVLTASQDYAQQDALLRFYFGGPATTDPPDSGGGQFCLTLLANGSFALHELDESDLPSVWILREIGQWSEIHRAGQGIQVLHIRPYDRDRLAIVSRGMNTPFSQRTLPGTYPLPALILATPGSRLSDLYRDQEYATGHRHTGTMTGPGIIRVDINRTYRHLFKIARIKHPETGFISDAPFSISAQVRPATPLALRLDRFLLPGTGLTGTIHNADTDELLPTNADGAFLTLAGVTRYYVKVAFTASPERFSTPILYGYEVSINGQFVSRSGLNLVSPAKSLESLSISGSDLTPDTETASVLLHDLGGTQTLLRTRDRIHSEIVVLDGSGTVVSRLFEGLTAAPVATLRGRPNMTYPDWRDVQIQAVGMWGRLAEQVPWLGDVPNFLDDRNTPLDPDGNRTPTPWRIVDVIRFLLNSAGVRDDEIDLPGVYDWARLWPSPGGQADDYLLMPGGDQSYTRLIQRLAKDYLGAILVRDPNAGPRGMWRLLPNPQPPYNNVVAQFDATRPAGSAHKSGTHPGTYGVAETWIEHFETWPQAPECNYVYVCGVGATDAVGEPSARVEAEFFNYVSHQFFVDQPIPADPTHPDFLGVMTPVYLCDPGLF